MPSLIARLPPSAIALLSQSAAAGLTILLIRLTGLPPSPLEFALLCGAFAAGLSHLVGLARWWLVIQFAFAPALVLMLALDIPSGVYLAAFLVLLVVYWSTFLTQVPLYLSSNKVWKALEDYLPQERNFRFIDLGCGLGGVLTHLARVRPEGYCTGIEAAPLPFLWSRLRVMGQSNCDVRWGSLWDCDLSQYDVVFAYLSPVPMEQLWRKARAEMRPGSVFISSTFSVPDQKPHETIQVDDLHRSTLLIWRM